MAQDAHGCLARLDNLTRRLACPRGVIGSAATDNTAQSGRGFLCGLPRALRGVVSETSTCGSPRGIVGNRDPWRCCGGARGRDRALRLPVPRLRPPTSVLERAPSNAIRLLSLIRPPGVPPIHDCDGKFHFGGDERSLLRIASTPGLIGCADRVDC